MNEYPTTDTGNAELFASLFRDRVRWDHRRHRWLVWSNRWQPDRDGEVLRLAVDATRVRYAEASQIEELKERGRVAAWAIASESRQKIDACLGMAKSIRPIADNGENWDRDTWLAGAPNGVVDLRTGELRDARPEDRITMSTGVDFDPEAECPRWLQFLAEVFPDADFVDWLQRALGYSLSGDTSEQIVILGHGSGANGKGVFNGTVNHVLGDYAYTAPFSTFELHQRASIPNDMAALEFKRFVSSSETNDNTRLNEARVKALSGCDPITARYLHQEFFTFWPHLKLWLFVNHRPKVTDDSFGFWRRVRLIPFTCQFTGQTEDRGLSEKLRAEGLGILAWIVRGCLAWQERGLEPVPDCVQVATQRYQEESDPLAAFIAEKCIEQAGATVQAADLYKAYKAWAEEQGQGVREVLTATTFGRRMSDKYSKTKRETGAFYQGIGLGADGFLTGLTLSNTKSDVSSICAPRIEENTEYPSNPSFEHENPSGPAPGDSNPSASGNGHVTLGMPAEDAIAIWQAQGSPPIGCGPATIRDLVKFLEVPGAPEGQLGIVRDWVEAHR